MHVSGMTTFEGESGGIDIDAMRTSDGAGARLTQR
jgi:hypothetical protein